eukprot:TRINITY_DN34810_c0_g1_i1.p1 TRINITY_DN34810_c0_g1~~TRINITY_DN34810_c0_g1_i1.p1  ORF type:complete len:137 (-),score=51.69 TRINITY_DN34810_c0_g1_i1:100-510(-)
MEVLRTNRLTDVQTRTASSRPSRRRELYDLPWDRRRFSLHRARVQSAGPRIDCSPPSSAGLMHVRDKRKKDQQEKERQAVIQSQNLIMLQHLSHIARSKRVDDGNMKKMHWKDFYLQIMVNPRLKTKGKIGPANEV